MASLLGKQLCGPDSTVDELMRPSLYSRRKAAAAVCHLPNTITSVLDVISYYFVFILLYYPLHLICVCVVDIVY